MRAQFPGRGTVRLFERVETVDPQYDVFDIGYERKDGGIDSLVVGGSFYTARSVYKAWADKCEAEAETTEEN